MVQPDKIILPAKGEPSYINSEAAIGAAAGLIVPLAARAALAAASVEFAGPLFLASMVALPVAGAVIGSQTGREWQQDEIATGKKIIRKPSSLNKEGLLGALIGVSVMLGVLTIAPVSSLLTGFSEQIVLAVHGLVAAAGAMIGGYIGGQKGFDKQLDAYEKARDIYRVELEAKAAGLDPALVLAKSAEADAPTASKEKPKRDTLVTPEDVALMEARMAERSAVPAAQAEAERRAAAEQLAKMVGA